MRTIHVAKDGSGEYSTIQAALDSLSANDQSGTLIRIHKGIYRERVTVRAPHVTLQGDSPEDTVLTYGLYAFMKMPDGQNRGTFRSYSCLIDTHDFTARDMTFENSSGSGALVGQALALYVDGDRIVFDNCRLLGGQDTLFTAPLPPKEIQPGGFIGPKRDAPRENGRHYYKNCYIEGDVDFVFGGATAYFEGCEFFSKNRNEEINSYVTAASTPEGRPYGYVMRGCRFTGDCPPATAYLGRPWRDYAKTVLIGCEIGAHIRPEGWHDWNKPQAHAATFYAEYGSTGPGGDVSRRAEWSHQLREDDLPQYTKEAVLGGEDGWNP